MAVYKIFPSQDATLYSLYPDMNTGLDSILEANTTYIDSAEVSRFLIKFSDADISSILTLIDGAMYTPYLRLYSADVSGMRTDTFLEVYPVSGSWDMGTGHYGDSPTVTNGVSWTYQTVAGPTTWPSASFAANTTGSFPTSNPGGGIWYTDYLVTQSFSYYALKDVLLDVNNIVTAWNNNTIANDGFIVKQPTNNEFVDSLDYQTKMAYYSRDTHTIYPPCLEFRWDDYTFNTGSTVFTTLDTDQIIVSIENNKSEYNINSIQKFRLNMSPKYPVRTFQTSSVYVGNYILPTSSLYAIKDSQTNEFIIDFDSNYTKLSVDSVGNYFTLYMNGLEPERTYEVYVKTFIDGETIILTNNLLFKVTNG